MKVPHRWVRHRIIPVAVGCVKGELHPLTGSVGEVCLECGHTHERPEPAGIARSEDVRAVYRRRRARELAVVALMGYPHLACLKAGALNEDPVMLETGPGPLERGKEVTLRYALPGQVWNADGPILSHRSRAFGNAARRIVLAAKGSPPPATDLPSES